jgi:ribosomal protein S14
MGGARAPSDETNDSRDKSRKPHEAAMCSSDGQKRFHSRNLLDCSDPTGVIIQFDWSRQCPRGVGTRVLVMRLTL